MPPKDSVMETIAVRPTKVGVFVPKSSFDECVRMIKAMDQLAELAPLAKLTGVKFRERLNAKPDEARKIQRLILRVSRHFRGKRVVAVEE